MNLKNILEISTAIFFWFLLKNPAQIHGYYAFSTSNFTEFILEQPEYFVDKSLMIQELLEDKSKIISIFRPKLWGKTLNLDMLHKFFEIEVDEEGNVVPDEKKINRKFFFGGELQSSDGVIKKLEPLKIANVTSAMEHQGVYPVIRIDLEYTKFCIYGDMDQFFMNMVLKLYKKYPYLKKYYESENENELGNLQKDQLRRYFMKNDTQIISEIIENMTTKDVSESFPFINMTTEDVSESIRFLSELLFKHFNRKVFIFVNDHHAPFLLNSAFPESFVDEYRNITKLLKELFCQTFNNNPYLEKAFFTDQIPLLNAHSEVFSHLNDSTVYTLLDDQFSQFYGFTQPEVDDLINKTKSVIYNWEIENLYKGYNHGREVVYNPTSVINHLHFEGQYDPCWLQYADIPGNVEKLISKNDYWPVITDLFSGYGIHSTIESTISCHNCTKPSSVYSLLVFSGFLNPISRIHPNNTYRLTIPNDEVKDFYRKKMKDRIRKKLFVDIEVNTNFVEFLPIDLVDGFKQGYRNYISSLQKLIQMKPNEQESAHEDLLLMLIDRLSSRYKTVFQKFPSTGETVAVLTPRVKYVDNAIFIGYKSIKAYGNLVYEAKICLQRVKSLKSEVENANRTRARNIVEIGITFCGSYTAVEHDIKLLK